MNLTSQLDEIDRFKYDYYHEMNSTIEGLNRKHLLRRPGSLVRAQLELHKSMARKGWSGDVLDELLAVSPDLFDSTENAGIHKIVNRSYTNAPITTNQLNDENVDSSSIASGANVTKETIRLNLVSDSENFEDYDGDPKETLESTEQKTTTDKDCDFNADLPIVSNKDILESHRPNSIKGHNSVDYSTE